MKFMVDPSRKTVNVKHPVKYELSVLKKQLNMPSENMTIAYLIEHYKETWKEVSVITEKRVRMDVELFYGNKDSPLKE